MLGGLLVAAALGAHVLGGSPALAPDTASADFTASTGTCIGCVSGHRALGPSSFDVVVDRPGTTLHVTIATAGEHLELILASPGSAPLAVGNYPDAAAPGTSGHPGLALSIDGGVACASRTGAFTITALDVAHDGFVRGLDLVFEHHCNGDASSTIGVVSIHRPVHAEVFVSSTKYDAFLPAASATAFAWSDRRHPRGQVAAWLARGSVKVVRVGRTDRDVYVMGMAGHELLLEESDGRSSDLAIIDARTLRRRALPAGINTKAPEWGASISARAIVFVRSVTSRSSVLYLYDRKRRKLQVLARTGKRQDFGGTSAVGRYVAYARCTPACRTYRRDISTGTTVTLPRLDPSYGTWLDYDPALLPDGSLFLVRSAFGCGANVSILRWVPGQEPTVVLSLPAGHDVDGTFAFHGTGPVELWYADDDCTAARADIEYVPLAASLAG